MTYTISSRDSGGYYHIQANGLSIATTKSRKAAKRIVQALDVAAIAERIMRSWNESIDTCDQCGGLSEHDPDQLCGQLWAAFGEESQ